MYMSTGTSILGTCMHPYQRLSLSVFPFVSLLHITSIVIFSFIYRLIDLKFGGDLHINLHFLLLFFVLSSSSNSSPSSEFVFIRICTFIGRINILGGGYVNYIRKWHTSKQKESKVIRSHRNHLSTPQYIWVYLDNLSHFEHVREHSCDVTLCHFKFYVKHAPVSNGLRVLVNSPFNSNRFEMMASWTNDMKNPDLVILKSLKSFFFIDLSLCGYHWIEY